MDDQLAVFRLLLLLVGLGVFLSVGRRSRAPLIPRARFWPTWKRYLVTLLFALAITLGVAIVASVARRWIG